MRSNSVKEFLPHRRFLLYCLTCHKKPDRLRLLYPLMRLNLSKKRPKQRLIDSLSEKDSDPFLIKEGKFDYRNLKDSVYYSDWTEESFLSDTGKKEALSQAFDNRNLRYFFIAFFLGFVILFSRAFWLQVVKGEYYLSMAEGNRLRSLSLEPKRGIIYSSDMRPLVRNKANFVLYLRPIDLPREELDRDKLLREVADAISVPASGSQAETNNVSGPELLADSPLFYEIKEKLSKVRIGSLDSYQPLFIMDNLDYDKAMLVKLNERAWPGVFVSNKIRREYLVSSANATSSVEVLSDNSLSHVLGYTGKINDKELAELGPEYSLIDYVGKSGLEYFYESELKGSPGKKNVEVDALGRQKKIINEEAPIDGFSLQLTIDLDLQLKAEKVLRSYLSKANLTRASFIALDPRDGSVLAMVSLPAYNNNLFTGGIKQADYDALINNPDRPLLNRSIAGEFPSGSTVKPVFAVGALEKGIINETTSFLSTGGIRIGSWFFPDWKAGGHGTVNVRSAIANSVNTFFYYIGGGYNDFVGLGVKGLMEYAKLFGLGEKTGIDLPGEATGFVPSPEWKEKQIGEPWYIGDTYHFAIGQGYLIVTPLQVANYAAMLANGGSFYQPHLIKSLFREPDNNKQNFEAQIIRSNFVSSDNMAIVRAGMRDAVTNGSARRLSTLPVEAAGKTGTAQWSTKKDPHAWFIGFAPYENPEIAIMVLFEEGVEGSTIAVPAAYDILNWYFGGRPADAVE